VVVKGSVIYKDFPGVNGSANPLKKNVEYILNGKKTTKDLCRYVLLDEESWEEDIKTVLDNAMYSGIRPCTHGVISVKGKIDPKLLAEKTAEFVTRIYGYRQAVIATHINRTHIHAHFVVNNIDVCTGKAYQASPRYLKKTRDTVNEIFSAIGFPLKGYPEYETYSREVKQIAEIVETKQTFKKPHYIQIPYNAFDDNCEDGLDKIACEVIENRIKAKKQAVEEKSVAEFYKRELRKQRASNDKKQLTRLSLGNFVKKENYPNNGVVEVEQEERGYGKMNFNEECGYEDEFGCTDEEAYKKIGNGGAVTSESSSLPTHHDSNGSYVSIRLAVPESVETFTPRDRFAVGTVLYGGVLLNKLRNGDYGKEGLELLNEIAEQDVKKYYGSR